MTTMELARPAQPAPLLPMEPEQASMMMERYRALCESILTADDVIGIPGQPGGFVKRSGFSKLATFYGVSTELLHQSMERDKDGKPIHAHAAMRAIAANGRRADGDGACAITEPRFKNPAGRQKAEHDVMATAVTRATNRAIANLIGFGSVSAEEVEGDTTPADRPYGEAASVPEEDGMLRALDDLGAGPKVANRVFQECGYLPRIAARAVMYAAADVRDRKAEADAKLAGGDEGTGTPPEEPDVVEDVLDTERGNAR